jgi:hypothetical protein
MIRTNPADSLFTRWTLRSHAQRPLWSFYSDAHTHEFTNYPAMLCYGMCARLSTLDGAPSPACVPPPILIVPQIHAELTTHFQGNHTSGLSKQWSDNTPSMVRGEHTCSSTGGRNVFILYRTNHHPHNPCASNCIHAMSNVKKKQAGQMFTAPDQTAPSPPFGGRPRGGVVRGREIL